jgi:hypothetical protein
MEKLTFYLFHFLWFGEDHLSILRGIHLMEDIIGYAGKANSRPPTLQERWQLGASIKMLCTEVVWVVLNDGDWMYDSSSYKDGETHFPYTHTLNLNAGCSMPENFDLIQIESWVKTELREEQAWFYHFSLQERLWQSERQFRVWENCIDRLGLRLSEPCAK